MQRETIITISTAHIKQETAKAIDVQETEDGFWPAIMAAPIPFGYLIPSDWIPEGEEGLRGIPPEVVKIIEFGNSNGAKFIRLDCDADTVDELETFDW